MRLLVDTNILLYAANRDCPEHATARSVLGRLYSEGTPWCLSWGILYEFMRVATHRAVFPSPLTAGQASGFLAPFLDSELVTVLAPTDRHRSVLSRILEKRPSASGNLFHDIHTAALMQEHGVEEILTSDTDFLQFDFLKVTDPVHEPK